MGNSIRIETVRTDGFTMDYFKFGSGDKTLVIIPGLSVDSVILFAGAVIFRGRAVAAEFQRRFHL